MKTENSHYIYIIISRTQTKFARLLRMVGGMKYNHSAISLDRELSEMYAFSRPQHRSLFLGKLVRETLDRYTLKKNHKIPVVVFQLPVSLEQYAQIRNLFQQIMLDSEYMYNLFSVLTYPITRGFSTYKSFNCTEFAAHILKILDYPFPQPAYRYKPDDLVHILEPYLIFDGDLRDYMICQDTDEQYFESYNLKMIYHNFCAMCKIIGRTYFS